MKEQNVLKNIMLAVAPIARVFRNNVGSAWIGASKKTKDGGVYISDPRHFKAGLCKGSSDLIGWAPLIVTQDMVGKKIAIFTALEVKAARGRASKDQINFINQVRLSGGIAGVVKSGIEASNLIETYNGHK